MRHVIPCLILGPLLSGCGSTRAPQAGEGSVAEARAEGPAIRVSYLSYKNGMEFELRSESHTSRAELYSQRVSLEQATIKVADDEIMAALVETLDGSRDGLGSSLQANRAPRDGRGVLWQMIEIEDASGPRHCAIGQGSTLEEIRTFEHARDVFLALYRETRGYQVIDNPGGVHGFHAGGTEHR